ncbi:MAG TPA: S1 RNA-binding domain-containing protein, partial [Candidatus Goldiibacteriota bacterium]|nr:S1 RNA-binding domain-containing protein [Candidatus Goldiibacteriota bacterium]
MDKNTEFRGLREGTMLKGRVLRKQDGDVFVDIDYKSEGIIPRDETSKYSYYEGLAEGSTIDVYVKKTDGPDGMVLLSKIIADKKLIFSAVKKAFKEGTYCEGRVLKAVKGGFIIDFGANVTAFLPMSHSKAYGEDITGKSLQFKIIQLDEEKRNVVVSYKEYVDEKMKKNEESFKKAFPAGQKVRAVIKAVGHTGLEVEREGVTGIVPLNEISWKKSDQIPESMAPGKEIELIVFTPEKGRPILSIRRLSENPFLSFTVSHKQGDRVKAKVVSASREGVTVEIEGGTEGFIPAGEISYYRRINDASNVLKPGEEVDACVIKLDEEENKIVLSIKRLEKNPWHSMDERYPVGARVIGFIKAIKEGEGVEVELDENFDAFVQIENISWSPVEELETLIKPGEKREFRILGIDKNKYRIMLGLKQLQLSPWAVFIAKHKEGSSMDAKVADVEDSAVVCLLGDGILGRIPIKNKAKISCKKGDIINVKI